MVPVASAAAAAVVALAGTSLAASGGGPNSTREAMQPAVSTNSLCQDLWAVVNSNATLVRAGCPGTSSRGAAGGGFAVRFPRNVRDCAYTATLGLSGNGGIQPAGSATVARLFGTPDGVYVATYNAGGVATQEPFHLSVSCAPVQRAGQVKISWPRRSTTFRVPGGVSADTVIVATPRNNIGVFVVAAVPQTSSGNVTIYLSGVPRRGHPAVVGWLAGH